MKLELYKFDSCPYCARVMRVIQQLGLEIEMCDIHQDPANLRTLVQVGGMNQVPCLFIDGSPLYESADIIAWLKQYAAEQQS